MVCLKRVNFITVNAYFQLAVTSGLNRGFKNRIIIGNTQYASRTHNTLPKRVIFIMVIHLHVSIQVIFNIMNLVCTNINPCRATCTMY